jgi:hypothetical protein
LLSASPPAALSNRSPPKDAASCMAPMSAILPKGRLAWRPTWSHRWRDLAPGRLRLDRLAAMAGGRTFFPCADAQFLRGKKVPPPPSSLRSGPGWCDRMWPSIAIETAMVAGSSSQGDTTWQPSVPSSRSAKASTWAKSLRLASAPRGPHHPRDGPQQRQRAEQLCLCLHNTSFRIIRFCGALQKVEVGACWRKRSNEGRDYLSIKLDDPSFKEPIYGNLFDDEGGETSSLIWSRGRRQNGLTHRNNIFRDIRRPSRQRSRSGYLPRQCGSVPGRRGGRRVTA